MIYRTACAILLCLVSLFTFQVSASAAQDDPPNVLLIMIEDLNDWVGYLDGPRITPNLDRLASSSHCFMNAYCVSPTCNASRVAMLTGQRPSMTGMIGNIGNFREMPYGDSRVTMPQFFRSEGRYKALSAGKIFHGSLGPKSDPISWDYQNPGQIAADGHHQYLDDVGIATWLKGVSSGNRLLDSLGVWGVALEKNGVLQKTVDTPEWKHVEYVSSYIKKSHEQPFLMGLGLTAPHMPFIAPKEFFDQVEARYPNGIPDLNLDKNDLDDIAKHAWANATTNFAKWTKKCGQRDDAIKAYLAAICFVDACLGHVLEALENGPNADNTIIVLASDHGFQFGHKDRWGKFELWARSSRVPFLIRLPGQTEGTRITHSVSLLDVFPTLTELTDLPDCKNCQGRSLVPLMESPDTQPISSSVINAVGYRGFRHEYGVHQDGWNYILRKNGAEELYNHAVDRAEVHNVSHLKENRHRKRRMAAEVVRSYIKEANQGLEFSGLDTLGSKAADSFDNFAVNLSDQAAWTTIRRGVIQGEQDFAVENGVANSVPGYLVAQHDLKLEAEHDFVVGTKVNFQSDGIGAGLVLGVEDQANYYEFLVTESNFNQGADVVFRRWKNGVEHEILIEKDLPNVEAGTTWHLVAEYDSRLSELTLTILDESKNAYFKETMLMEAPANTGFGISSFFHSSVEVDYFHVATIPQLPLVESDPSDFELVSAINGMEHIDTFEHLERRDLAVPELGWTVQKTDEISPGRLLVTDGTIKSDGPDGKAIAIKTLPQWRSGEEFVLASKLKITGQGESAGLVFFHEDGKNYFELLLVDQRSSKGGVFEVVQWEEGKRNILDSKASVSGIQFGHEYALQLNFSQGQLNLEVFDLTENRQVYVQDLELKGADGSRFGVSINRHGRCEFDYFRVVCGTDATDLAAKSYLLK